VSFSRHRQNCRIDLTLFLIEFISGLVITLREEAYSLSFEMWAEKYRPKTLSEIVNQKEIVERLKSFAKSKNVPHCSFVWPETFMVMAIENTSWN